MVREMIKSISFALCILTTSAFAGQAKKPAPAECPGAVKTALDKAFPGSKAGKCNAEREKGRDQFELKLTKADGNAVDVDVDPDGRILQVEEKVALDQVPAAVTKAFATKYPKAKASGAEKQTPSGGPVTYEVAFSIDKATREATFTADGKFIEEE